MNLQTFLITLESAIALGSVYALLALSFTLVYSSTGYFHLGVGGFVTLGVIGAYVGSVTLGLPWIVTAALVIVLVAGLGLLSEVVAVRPVRGRTKHDHFAVIVSTLAFMILVNAIIELLFGSDELRVPAYWPGDPFQIGDVPVQRIYIVIVSVLAIVALGLEFVMRRTGVGRILRAAQVDPTGLELLGVSFRKVVLGTFALAGGLAGLAGVLISPISYASPFVGTDLLVYGFAAMGVGGFGSFAGSMLGGLVIGLVVAFEPTFASVHLADPLAVLVVLVVLLIFPSGLLGRRAVREV